MPNPRRYDEYWNPDAFRSLLRECGLSYNEVSRVTGVGVDSLRSYAYGRAEPGLSGAVRLADFFGVPADVLVGRTTEEEYKTIMQDYPARFMQLRRRDFDASFVRRGGVPYDYEVSQTYMEPPYPYNLLDDIVMGSGYGQKKKRHWDDFLDADQEAALKFLISQLSEREQVLIRLHYAENQSLDQCGRAVGITRERCRQILAKTIRRMRHSTRIDLIRYGLEGYERVRANKERREAIEREEQELDEMEEELVRRRAFLEMDGACGISMLAKESVSLADMDLSVRSFNCLRRSGCRTLEDVCELAKSGGLLKVMNLGKRSLSEILGKCEELAGEYYRGLYAG